MRAGLWIVAVALVSSAGCARMPEIGWTPMPYQTAGQRRRADDARPHPRLARPGVVNVTTAAPADDAWSGNTVLAQLTLDGLRYRSLGAPPPGSEVGPADLLDVGESAELASARWWAPRSGALAPVGLQRAWAIDLRAPVLGQSLADDPYRLADDLRLGSSASTAAP